MSLLGGLPVFEAEACGDLLPGRSAAPGLENEVVLMLVKVAAQGADGGKAGQGVAGGCGSAGGCQ
ncbi:MAG: hypothetical protein ACLQDY_16095 [Streptosporangiaceae bacterium]